MKNPSANHSGLRHAVEMLRKKGQGGDSVLAHISPEEARYMQQRFGNDVNPHTGLPQFGLFRKLEKAVRKPFKMIAPVAGSIVGGLLGGPAGAIAGGALGGGLTSRNHMLDHALGGAAVGLGHSLLSPMIGQGLGLAPESMMGKAMMTGVPSLGSQLGLGSAVLSGGSKFFGGNTAVAPVAEETGGLGGLGGLGLSGKGLIDTALLATTLGGVLKAKTKMPPYGSPENETIHQAIQRNKPVWGPEDAYRPPVQENKQPKFPPRGYRKSKWKFFPTPEEQEAQLLEATTEMAEPGYERRYAKGGQVKGYYDGEDGGQSDKIPVKLPEKSYIMDATTVSLVGDGNSKHGARKIKQLVSNFERSGIVKDYKPSRNIKAMVSDGELYLSPKEVAAAGGGSIDKGVKKLDKFRKNLRKHKGVKKFLPPKSKPLAQYLR